MNYSYTQYTGDGVTNNYTFAFTYIDPSYVKVRVDNSLVPFTFLNSSTVSLATTPTAGATVEIRRETAKQSRLVDFQDGSVLTENALDLSAQQTFDIVQEAFDRAAGVTPGEADHTADGLRADLADSSVSKGANLVGFSHATTYALGTVGSKLRQSVSVKDAPYNAKGDGVTDDTAAINAAFASGALRIHIPAGTYVLSNTLYLPMGKTVSTDGYETELQFFGLNAAMDGISVTENASYDFTIIQPMTIRTMNANGRYGIVTPLSGSMFTNKRPQFFIDALFLGEDKGKTIFTYGWAEMVRIGDSKGGELNIAGNGRYNATIDDTGQVDDVGVRLTSSTGNIGMALKVTLGNVRRGVVLGNGTEGFSLQDGSEMVGCWYGLDCDSATSEPGGFIGAVHVNANNRGFRIVKRSEMTIGRISAYRSDAFFKHGGTWAGLDVTDSSLQITGVNVVQGTTHTTTTNSYGAIFRRTSGTFSNYDIRMGAATVNGVGILIDDSDDFLVGAGSFLEVAKLFQFQNGSTDIHIGPVTMRGLHTATTTKFDFDGTIDRARIYIDKKRVTDLNGLYTLSTVDAAGTLVLTSGVGAPVQTVIVNPGAGAYTYNIDLDEAQAVVGDTIRIKLIMPTSTNPTIRIRRKTSAFAMSTFPGSTPKRYVAEYLFTGATWEEMFVFESTEANF